MRQWLVASGERLVASGEGNPSAARREHQCLTGAGKY